MKHLNITFFLFVLMSMVGKNSFAHNIEVKNEDGVTIYYNWINNQTELSVSFCGNYIPTLRSYTGTVVIPESVIYNGHSYPVTGIGFNAFYDCLGLTGITIPKSVTVIGNNVFDGCI